MKRLLVIAVLCLLSTQAGADFRFPLSVAPALPTVSIAQICQLTAVVTANSACVLPAKAVIDQIIIRNSTANAITGGLKFGTTSGATDIVTALAVAGNVLTFVTNATLLKPFFSTTATQTIFIDTVTLWNAASVDIWIVYWVLT